MQNFTGVGPNPNPNPNLLINGDFGIAQRATTGTITGSTGVPTASQGYQVADNWFGYSSGGTPTVAQIAGSGNVLNLYQITGAAGVTLIGIGQRIESINAVPLAGNTATLSVDLSNSVPRVVTWTASYPTTAADAFGTVGTPSKTQIAAGSFSVTSTLTRFTASFACDFNVRKGLEIVFTVGAQTSGTWIIGNAKIEAGSTATAFVNPDFTGEMLKCQRYYEQLLLVNRGYCVDASSVIGSSQQFRSAKFSSPISTLMSVSEAINLSFRSVSFPGLIRVLGVRFLSTSSAAGELTDVCVYSFSSQIP